ncbi:SAVMC3_10250 family protein [Streptomyces sp. DSM 41524]|uniref:SAVMC3_10250 family protein n=1 Tax=Streptomyces asiaticus subsp. ignotus TaxID=3098222 RepID=A0ABU7QC06_9ACTN|nr:SAVMC3_10250 family protein [Streptomyces sp. DSM 41524]
MREIAYLSEGKLRQFIPEPRRLPRASALRLTTPFGGIDVDAPAPEGEFGQLRHLREVHQHLELVAEWYTEPQLRPGQWVQFEAPLRCVTLSGADQDLVLFVDSVRAWGANRATAGDCRLLMHGSARHLRGWTPMPVDGPELEVVNSASSLGASFVTRAGQVVEALTRHREPPPGNQPSPRTAADLHGRGVQALLHALDEEDTGIDTSAMMTGYARVTGLLPGTDTTSPCLVASPLVVEYAAAIAEQRLA